MRNRGKLKKCSSSRCRKYKSDIFRTPFKSPAKKHQPLPPSWNQNNLWSSAHPPLAVRRKEGKSINSHVSSLFNDNQDQEFSALEKTCREFYPKVTSTPFRQMQSIEQSHQNFCSHHDDHHVRQFIPNLAPEMTRSRNMAERHDDPVHVIAIDKVTNWLQNQHDNGGIAEITEIDADVSLLQRKQFEIIESDVATNNSTCKEVFNYNLPEEMFKTFENDFKPYNSHPAFNDRKLMPPPSTSSIPFSRDIHYRDADQHRRALISPSFRPYTTDTTETKFRIPKSDITLDTTVEDILGLVNTLEKDDTTNSLDQSVVEWTGKQFSKNELETNIDQFWKNFAKFKVNSTLDSSNTDDLGKRLIKNVDLDTFRQREGDFPNILSAESSLNHRQKLMQEVDNSVQGLESGFQPIGRENLSKGHQQHMFRSNYERKHHEMKLLLEDSFSHQTLATNIMLEPQNSYRREVLLDNHHIDKVIRSLERETSPRQRNNMKFEKFL